MRRALMLIALLAVSGALLSQTVGTDTVYSLEKPTKELFYRF
jgi:hypothetical protein